MKKTIRATYPLEFSIGLLILIFVISFFLSSQIFDVNWRELIEGRNIGAYGGMLLISTAVIIMALILWEEFLFPVTVKPGKSGVVFRNHRNKLRTQLLIYCAIPAIFLFVYWNYQIHEVRFFVWAAVCTIVPVIAKLISGLNNYNDFLKLSDETIEFKNNKKSGVFPVKDIQRITLKRDENNVLHKLEISAANNSQLIDLDEMELEAFLHSIDRHLTANYKHLLA